MKKVVAAVIGLVLLAISIEAQSLHYTYWDHAPLVVNPGLTGAYHGTVRVSGIHRSQYGFRTLVDLGVEYNLPFRPRKRDWIAGGLSLSRDVSGALDYGYNLFRLSGAYHFALNKEATSDIALGVQLVSGGLTMRTMGTDLTFVQLEGTLGSDRDLDMLTASAMGGDGPSASFTDWRAGLTYSTRGEKGSMQFGIQAANILGPNVGLRATNTSQLDLRFGGFFLMDRMINDRISILPAALAQVQGNASEVVLRTMMGLDMKKDYVLRLKAGLGYRFGDSGHLLIGADYKDWKFGLAFDITVSNLATANNSTGAIELSAVKQFNIRKKPNVKPVIFCPRI